MSITFNAPATGGSGDRYTERDANGHVVLIYVKSYESAIPTTRGDKDAVRLNVVDLETGEHHTDVLWFGGRIVGSLKRQIGQFILAQVAQGEPAKPGDNPPWILNDATHSDKADAAAKAWLAANPGVLDDAPKITAPTGVAASSLI